MKIGDLHVTISGASAFRSLVSVVAVALQHVTDDAGRDLAHRLGALLEQGDLFGAEPADLAAPGANKLDPIELEPNDRYVELATAIAAHGNANVTTRHGWPVLSVASPPATVAEAAGESILGGGGGA